MDQQFPSQEVYPEIVIPHHISSTFVETHYELNFLYGNDVSKRGIMGQPWVFVGHPNAFEIPTLVRYCPAQKSFFNDGDFSYFARLIDEALAVVPRDKPIIPCPKIGMGCSNMHAIAPKLFAYMTEQINKIKYKNIRIRYQ